MSGYLFEKIGQSFTDELNKISTQKVAGELQGHVRSGRRPLHVDTLLEQEEASEARPSDVAKTPAEKVSSALPSKGQAAALVGTGLVGGHVLRQANEDRKVGKMIRKQQQ